MLGQAAAYLHQQRLSPRAYLDELADAPAVMYDKTACGADADRAIGRIWRLTLDRICEDTPLAGDVLRVLAWCAPEAIPHTLLDALLTALTNSLPTPSLGSRGGVLARLRRRPPLPPPVSPPAAGVTVTLLRRTLGALAAYNMITLDEGGAVTVHRLVQAVARTPDPADPHRQPDAITTARDTATRLLNQTAPAYLEDPTGWHMWRTLLPHIDALADYASPSTDTHLTPVLLTRTARFLQNQELLARAIIYLERAVTTAQRLHGPHHPHTLASRNNLALSHRAEGDLSRAIPLLQQTLADCERVLGPHHPITKGVRRNLQAVTES